ncbi:YhzD family protein [Siminovitchia sediminis]|uniref:YhzD family protein n=1 Tax=Siminovitchia sediminis TaxID=1274353 RepID=A0ABW4KJE4_9BACI
MGIYRLTAFEATGEKILDEAFDSGNDEEAKEKGTALLSEKGMLHKTHRCSSPQGKLILFHR